MLPLLLLSFLLLESCEQSINPKSFNWQNFNCRDAGHFAERIEIYRAKVPLGWKRKDPSEESIADTTMPICEFFIGNQPNLIHLTIHTFYSDKLDQRIPPEAQIHRWKRQFDELHLTSLSIEPTAHGGFSGYAFAATGIFKNKEQSVMGFAMQLAPQHWLALHARENALFKQKQMSSDYTIKAIGNPQSLEEYKQEIEIFAHSFELIEEIPSR